MLQFHFENKHKSLLPYPDFLLRVARYGFYSASLIAFSVGLGTVGYHHFAELGWVDSFYNACMILTGMGPVSPLTTDSAKLFASFYALYSGIAFLSTVGVFFAPIAHRFMHMLHVEHTKSKPTE